MPIAAARAALRLTRHKVSDLITVGVLSATNVARRQCVLLSSAIAYGDRQGIPAARAALEAHAIDRRAA